MPGLKGIGIAIFVFIGAITLTFVSVQILTMDSQWHLGQRVTQTAAIESCRAIYYDELNHTDPFIIPRSFTINVSVFINLIAIIWQQSLREALIPGWR